MALKIQRKGASDQAQMRAFINMFCLLTSEIQFYITPQLIPLKSLSAPEYSPRWEISLFNFAYSFLLYVFHISVPHKSSSCIWTTNQVQYWVFGGVRTLDDGEMLVKLQGCVQKKKG